MIRTAPTANLAALLGLARYDELVRDMLGDRLADAVRWTYSDEDAEGGPVGYIQEADGHQVKIRYVDIDRSEDQEFVEVETPCYARGCGEMLWEGVTNRPGLLRLVTQETPAYCTAHDPRYNR